MPEQVGSNSAVALVLDHGAANLETLQAVRSGEGDTGSSVRVVVIGTGPASARRRAVGGGTGRRPVSER